LAASAVAVLFISQLSTLSIRSISANCCRRNEEGLLKVMGGSMYVRVKCHGGARTTLNIYTAQQNFALLQLGISQSLAFDQKYIILLHVSNQSMLPQQCRTANM